MQVYKEEDMQRRWLCTIALLLILLSILLIIVPNTSVFAHNGVAVDTPTPTPDANAILNKANDASNQAEHLNTVVIIALTIVGIVLTALALVFSVVALLGISSFRDINSLKEQIRQDLEDMRKDAAATRGSLVYLGLGDRLMSKGSIKEAIESYRKAATFSPKDDQINYVLGRIYSGAGYFDDAITAFSAATRANPGNAEAWRDLGLAYRRRGEKMSEPKDYDKAIENLQKALTLKPDDDDAYAVIGGLYRRQGEYQRALANYKQAYSINSSSSYALGNIASILWHLGEVVEARNYFADTERVASRRIAVGTPEGYWDYYDLALSQLGLGKSTAIDSYKQAIANTPAPGRVVFEGVLDNLKLLQTSSTSISDLPRVIQLIEEAKSKSL
jgi:tetratricopeptide (TPR) repeat protein